MFFGLVLVIIGVVFLLQSTGVLTGDAWKYIWPSLIIFFGLSILFKPARKKFFWGQRHYYEHEEKKKEENK